ncbi:MAG: rRNA maturation RNase YbeY [Ruminococcaceae bacterium]|nr:rRNA maturation RNase YbeY [Oscillospiraceae bacterium]
MNVKIYFSNKQKKMRAGISLRLLVTKAIRAALEYEGFRQPSGVSVTFTDNEGIRTLNREYREKDTATDVLSFPLYDFAAGEKPLPDERIELGDIVLSLERAKEQAAELGHSYERESAFLCVHSVLHLLGYDHELSEEDEEDMCRRQREIMKKLGL